MSGTINPRYTVDPNIFDASTSYSVQRHKTRGSWGKIETLLIAYLRLGKCLLATPFNVVATDQGLQCVPLAGVSKILMIGVNLFVDVMTLANSCKFLVGTWNEKGITVFVSKLTTCVWFLYYATYRYVLYTRRARFETLLERLSKLQDRLCDDFKAQAPTNSRMRAITAVFLGYVLIKVVINIARSAQERTPSVAAANNSWCEHTYYVSYMVAEVTVQLPNAYAFPLPLLNACILWTLAKMFMDRLKKLAETPLDIRKKEMILNTCVDMLDYSEAVEDVIGLHVFAFCFSLLPFYSVRLVQAFSWDWSEQFRNIWGLLVYAVTLCVSADANAMLKDFGSYLLMSPTEAVATCETEEDMEEEAIQTDRLRILLHRISNNGYGIKGKAFTITYGFVGNLAGLILTYSIIVLQFQGPTG